MAGVYEHFGGDFMAIGPGTKLGPLRYTRAGGSLRKAALSAVLVLQDELASAIAYRQRACLADDPVAGEEAEQFSVPE